MVMLLFDYEKAYNRVEWGFLEGAMVALGFDSQWIVWTHILYADKVGLNGMKNKAFKLSRLVRQGCLLAPF
jgi:hypothetical protein